MRAQRSVAGLVSEARRRLRLKIEKIGGDATCGGVDLVVASGATRACRGSARMSSSGKSDGATIRALAFEKVTSAIRTVLVGPVLMLRYRL